MNRIAEERSNERRRVWGSRPLRKGAASGQSWSARGSVQRGLDVMMVIQ